MKCRICPRCGGNHFIRTAGGYKCAYCDTLFMEDPTDTPDEKYVNFDDIDDDLKTQVFYDTRSERLRIADFTIRAAILRLILLLPGFLLFLYGVTTLRYSYKYDLGIGILLSVFGAALFALGLFLVLKILPQFKAAIKTKIEIERTIQIHE